ncbi:MAG: DNA translocase FtsK 4TM domain-containing protein [Thermoanaerobacteraceae bacterium]|nr:DNA translocase FtsK 4TM domain-containing protein [Thermoanaerobacteraceae bacterium]
MKNKSNSRTYLLFMYFALLVLAIFAFISNISSDTGIVGEFFRDSFQYLFGNGDIGFSVLLIFILFYKIYTYKNLKLHGYKIYLLVFIYLALLSLINIYNYPEVPSFSEYIMKSISPENIETSGGITGSVLSYILISLFGITGSYAVLILSIIINMAYMIDPGYIREIIAYKTRKNRQVMKEASLTRETNDMAIEETRVNDKQGQNVIDELTKIKIVDFLDQSKEHLSEPKPSNTKIINSIFNYDTPDINLLNSPNKKSKDARQDYIENARILEQTLFNFGIEAKVMQINHGPAVTRYELQLSPGIKVSKILSLQDDIALAMATQGIRIEAPIPGKSAVGIEVPNKKINPVYIREVLSSKEFQSSVSNLSFALGKDITGNNVIGDLSSMPHLLIAGATGSGKSVCLNTIIISLLYKSPPNQARLILIDPKVVELGIYNGIPHLLIPVVTDPIKAAQALNWAVQEMINRYKIFAENNVRDIDGYNKLYINEPDKYMPKIAIIIDELSDLMMVSPAEVEDYICRLAQMARAAGIHLIIATQRPSVNVITGIIKANIPSRISFAVSSQIDSRTILDIAGAEKLLGKGDMLYMPIGINKPIRVQGAFITEEEVQSVVNYLKEKYPANYDKNVEDVIEEDKQSDNKERDYDELLPKAVEIAIESNQASASLLQRRLRIGYNRAARIIEQMEELGFISGYDNGKPREVLITREQWQKFFNSERRD